MTSLIYDAHPLETGATWIAALRQREFSGGRTGSAASRNPRPPAADPVLSSTGNTQASAAIIAASEPSGLRDR